MLFAIGFLIHLFGAAFHKGALPLDIMLHVGTQDLDDLLDAFRPALFENLYQYGLAYGRSTEYLHLLDPLDGTIRFPDDLLELSVYQILVDLHQSRTDIAYHLLHRLIHAADGKSLHHLMQKRSGALDVACHDLCSDAFRPKSLEILCGNLRHIAKGCRKHTHLVGEGRLLDITGQYLSVESTLALIACEAFFHQLADGIIAQLLPAVILIVVQTVRQRLQGRLDKGGSVIDSLLHLFCTGRQIFCEIRIVQGFVHILLLSLGHHNLQKGIVTSLALLDKLVNEVIHRNYRFSKIWNKLQLQPDLRSFYRSHIQDIHKLLLPRAKYRL